MSATKKINVKKEATKKVAPEAEHAAPTVGTLVSALSAVTDKDNVSGLLFTCDSANKANKTVWSTLCCIFAAKKADSMDALGEYLTANIPEMMVEEIPFKKDGSIPFRSWSTTKNLWKYATYLMKAADNNGGIESVLPADKPLPTLSEIKKLAYGEKKEKSDLEKFTIMLNSISSVFDKLSGQDLVTAKGLLKDSSLNN